MSVYPKIEVKRDVATDSEWPHELWLDGSFTDYVTDSEADHWEEMAKFTEPLPDCVRWATVAKGSEIPEGWERRVSRYSWTCAPPSYFLNEMYEVRPPSKPATEKIPWHATAGRTTPAGVLVTSAGDDYQGGVYVAGEDGRSIAPDGDGMVEVLVES